MSKPINTCVLGVGLSGLTFHIPFILALPHLFSLHSVLERNPRAEGGKVYQRFGVSVKIHKTFDDVLADPAVELVIVATPNDTHYTFTKAVLQAGKHVLVDKPITDTLQQAQELEALAESRKLVLYAYQNRRWDSDFLSLKRLLMLPQSNQQSLGNIIEFESHHDRYRKHLKGTWKDRPLPGAGMLYDLGSHLLDQALTLFGRPDSVTAFLQNLRVLGDPDIDDFFTVHLHYPQSPIRQYPLNVILRSHPLSVRSPQLRYIVRGTRGTYVKYGVDTQEDQLKVISSPNAILEEQFGREPEYLSGKVESIEADDETITKSTWPSTDAGAYIDIFRNLGAAIREGAMISVKWSEAMSVIELIELARESAKRGVTLSVPA